MPYETRYEEKGVYWRYNGVVTGAEILQSNFEFYGDERFDEMRYQISDFLEAQSILMTESEARKLAFLDVAAARSNGRMKVAVVSGEGMMRKIVEMYSKHTIESPWETRLFESLEDAREWIHRVAAHSETKRG